MTLEGNTLTAWSSVLHLEVEFIDIHMKMTTPCEVRGEFINTCWRNYITARSDQQPLTAFHNIFACYFPVTFRYISYNTFTESSPVVRPLHISLQLFRFPLQRTFAIPPPTRPLHTVLHTSVGRNKTCGHFGRGKRVRVTDTAWRGTKRNTTAGRKWRASRLSIPTSR
jgi:hypothetical protein